MIVTGEQNVDRVVSAIRARAGLQRLLAAATQKPRAFDVILVDDTSRLSRKMIDSLKIFEQLRFVTCAPSSWRKVSTQRASRPSS